MEMGRTSRGSTGPAIACGNSARGRNYTNMAVVVRRPSNLRGRTLMPNVKLLKKHFKGAVIFYSDSWVSNGHFIFRRSFVKDGDALANDSAVGAILGGSPRRQDDAFMESVIDGLEIAEDEKLLPLEDINILLSTGQTKDSLRRCLASPDNNTVVWLRDDYLRMVEAFNLSVSSERRSDLVLVTTPVSGQPVIVGAIMGCMVTPEDLTRFAEILKIHYSPSDT